MLTVPDVLAGTVEEHIAVCRNTKRRLRGNVYGYAAKSVRRAV
jgi:hypothetical protein